MDCFFLLAKDIDFVRINFENYTHIDISTHNIINLVIGNFNYENETLLTDNLNFILAPGANISCRFGYYPLPQSCIFVFDRILLQSDIVSIEIHKNTGENLEIWIPYEEDERGFNAAQNCYIGKTGELHIEIKEAE